MTVKLRSEKLGEFELEINPQEKKEEEQPEKKVGVSLADEIKKGVEDSDLGPTTKKSMVWVE
jgi:hypothetical protein